MDSFKRNKILFATFSFAILHIITPVNADLYTDDIINCLQQIEKDQIKIDKVFESINDIRDPTVNDVRYFMENIEIPSTPNGKAFHKAFVEYKIHVFPIVFCWWIKRLYVYPHFDASAYRDQLEIDIQVDTNINTCKEELEKDFGGEEVNIIENATTLHGMCYDKRLNIHKIEMTTEGFCLWIYKVPDFSASWKEIMGDITFVRCIGELDNDKYDTDNEYGQFNRMKLLDEYFSYNLKTFHGLNYRNILLESDKDPDPVTYKNAKQYCQHYISITIDTLMPCN